MTFDLQALSTVPELIIERANATPNCPAWRTWENGEIKTTTWQEYYHSILTLAHGLSRSGIKAGDRIAICARNSLQWELMEKAGLFLEATIIGIDAHAPLETQHYILNHAQVNVLVVDRPTTAYSHSFKCIITLESDNLQYSTLPSPLIEYSTLIQSPTTDALPLPNKNSMATIIYTSGSTGSPKGIPYNQRQYLVTAQAILDPRLPSLAKGKTEDEISICWLPLSNLFQRVINTIMIAWGGCSYVLNDPKNIMETVIKVNPTLMIGVPRFYEKLQSSVEHRIHSLPSFAQRLVKRCLTIGEITARYRESKLSLPWLLQIKYWLAEFLILGWIRNKLFGKNIYSLITGSAPTPIHVLNFFRSIGISLMEAYGLSENIIPIAMNRPGALRVGSTGRPLLLHDVVIAEDGEVMAKGPGVFHGYLGDEGQEERISSDGFLGTGDYGYIDNDGFLFLTGRKSDLIKTSTGRRIFPKQIETKLTNIPLIENAVVIGNNQKYLTVILALAPSYYTSSEDVKAQCLSHIITVNSNTSSYECIFGALLIPQGFSIEKGHLTSNMKIRRKAIEQQYQEHLATLYETIDSNKSSNPVIIEVVEDII